MHLNRNLHPLSPVRASKQSPFEFTPVNKEQSVACSGILNVGEHFECGKERDGDEEGQRTYASFLEYLMSFIAIQTRHYCLKVTEQKVSNMSFYALSREA